MVFYEAKYPSNSHLFIFILFLSFFSTILLQGCVFLFN